MPFSRTGRVKIIITAAVVMLATLAYLEAGVRFLGDTAFPLLRTDPEVGSIHVKNFSGYAWDVESERKNYIRTNSLGYVGEDVSLDKPTSTARIAMLGDSTLAGLQVDYFKNFTYILGDTLTTAHLCGKNKFEVMNFGVGSAGTFLEYQIYKYKVIPYHPDYVYLFFHDDYEDNLSKSNFSLENYASERRAVGLKSFLLQFQLPKLIFSKLKNNQIVLAILKGVGLFEMTDTSSVPASEATSTSPADVATTERYYAYTFDVMDRLRDLVVANGSTFVVVLFPQENDLSGPGMWKNDKATVALRAHLEQAGIPFINPADDMAGAKEADGGGCLSFGCKDHLNEKGHQIMASFLFADMKARLPGNRSFCPTP